MNFCSCFIHYSRLKLSEIDTKRIVCQFLEAKKTPISTPSNVICSGLEDQQKGASTFDNSEQSSSSAPEDYWEECGCILWDLSVESIQATLMVLIFFDLIVCSKLVFCLKQSHSKSTS